MNGPISLLSFLSTGTPIYNLWQEYNNNNNSSNNNNNKKRKNENKLHLAPYLQPYRKNNWGGKTLTKAAEKP